MRVVWLAVVSGISACYPVSNVCDETKTPLLDADGGALRCALASDCPRQAEQLFCVNPGVPTTACVSCEGTQCVLHQPVRCQ